MNLSSVAIVFNVLLDYVFDPFCLSMERLNEISSSLMYARSDYEEKTTAAG